MLFRWEKRPEDAFVELYDAYIQSIMAAIRTLARQFAAQIEAWMKTNAIWQDRTGNARQSLFTEVEDSLLEIAIFLSHGVEYGVYLELSNQGRFAIIGPALDKFAIEFWNAVKALLR